MTKSKLKLISVSLLGLMVIGALALAIAPPVSWNLSELPAVPENKEYTLTHTLDVQDYIDAASNIDSHADHGTHDVFADLTATDTVMDLMSEANTGAAPYVLGAQGGTGSSYQSISANYAYGCTTATASTTGTVTGGVFYGRSSTGTINAKMFITDSGGTIITNGISNAVGISTTAGDKSFTWATPPTITATLSYMVWVIAASSSIRLYYYDTTSGSSVSDTTNSYTSPSSPTDHAHGTYLWRMCYITVTPTPNYELNLEGSFTSVDYSQTNEQLCIKTGTHASGSESFNVQVWNGAWTTVITGLTWSAWNNVSVGAYLTASTFYILFIGATESSDTAQDTINIDSVLLHLWRSNNAPANDIAPDVPSSGWFARYAFYSISCSVQDTDGYSDIDYIEVFSPDVGTPWTIRFDEDTNAFSVPVGSSYMSVASWSTYAKSGPDLDVSFQLKVSFSHTQAVSIHLHQYVIDEHGGSDTDEYLFGDTFNVYKNLQHSAELSDGSGTTDRGPVSGSITASGNLYYDSYSGVHPLNNETDLYISCTGVTGSPWTVSSYTEGTGVYSATVAARTIPDVSPTLSQYSFYAVLVGAGSGGSHLSYDGAHNYIADRVKVISYSSDDSRINVGNTAGDHVTLQYEYDSAIVATGTVTVNSNTTTYSGAGGIWNFGQSSSICQTRTYNTVSTSGTDTHGINIVNQNGQSLAQKWDRVKVLTTTVDDSRISINGYAEIRVTAQLELDGHGLGSGDTITLNGVSMTWDSVNAWFDLSVTKSSVGGWSYFVNSTSEATYGITALNLNGKSQFEIYDRNKVMGLYANTTSPTVGFYVLFNLTAVYEYDNTAITAGTSFLLENITLAWNSGLGVWEATDHRDYVVSMIYDTVTGTSTLYGVSVWNMNGFTLNVTWVGGGGGDTSIHIVLSVNYGWTVILYNVTISWTGHYEPSGDPFTGSITLNTTASTLYPVYSTIGLRAFTVTGVNDPEHGLTDFEANTISVTWDAIEVSSAAWVWEQADLSSIWLIWNSGVFHWAINDTDLSAGEKIASYANGTDSDYAYTDAYGSINDLWIGTFNSDWYYANVTIQAEGVTVGDREFTTEVWSDVLPVPIEHSIHIASMQITETEERVIFGVFTIWGNSTITIWDGNTLVKYQETEGYFWIPKEFAVAGLHNLTILVNATDGGGHQSQQTKNFVQSDFWLWINYPYNTPLASGSFFGESVIRNELGSPNILEIQLYHQLNPLTVVGPRLEINVTIVRYYVPAGYWDDPDYLIMGMWCEWDIYEEWRTTDPFGRLYWTIDSTFADLLCNAGPYAYSPYIVVYASGQEVGQYVCLKWWSPIISGKANSGGVYIVIDPAYAYLTVNNTRYSYATVSGIPGAYLWTVTGTISGVAHSYSGTSDIGSIYLPDILTETVSFTVSVWQTLEANLIFCADSAIISISPDLDITAGVAIAQERIVTFNARTNQACNVTVSESGVAVASAEIGQTGYFSLWWNRSIGSGDILATMYFYTASSSVTVNVTYAQLTDIESGILDMLDFLIEQIDELPGKVLIPVPYDPTEFVISVAIMIGLGLFAGGVLYAWTGRGESRREYHAALSGQR